MIIYLYIKECQHCGLKYFGKTKKIDPFKYQGSGDYWINHLQFHKNPKIKTLEIFGFDSQILCTEFALKFSEENNIVNSRLPNGKKVWANLDIENGIDGVSPSQARKQQLQLAAEGRHNFTSEKTKKWAAKRITENNHQFLDSEWQTQNQLNRVENGTHPFLGGKIQAESNKKRVENGTHNFLSLNKKRVENGSHHLLGGEIVRAKRDRDNYKLLKSMYINLGIKQPRGMLMKKDDWINTKIEEFKTLV